MAISTFIVIGTYALPASLNAQRLEYEPNTVYLTVETTRISIKSTMVIRNDLRSFVSFKKEIKCKLSN